MSALEGAKLGVYRAMTDQRIKKSELARRLGWHLPQVDRLFDLRHASRLDQKEAAARVLGRHLEVRVASKAHQPEFRSSECSANGFLDTNVRSVPSLRSRATRIDSDLLTVHLDLPTEGWCDLWRSDRIPARLRTLLSPNGSHGVPPGVRSNHPL